MILTSCYATRWKITTYYNHSTASHNKKLSTGKRSDKKKNAHRQKKGETNAHIDNRFVHSSSNIDCRQFKKKELRNYLNSAPGILFVGISVDVLTKLSKIG